MPLSPPAPREVLHDRRIECAGYHREDGLWDIEGHIVDTKPFDFETSFRGAVTAGTPVMLQLLYQLGMIVVHR